MNIGLIIVNGQGTDKSYGEIPLRDRVRFIFSRYFRRIDEKCQEIFEIVKTVFIDTYPDWRANKELVETIEWGEDEPSNDKYIWLDKSQISIGAMVNLARGNLGDVDLVCLMEADCLYERNQIEEGLKFFENDAPVFVLGTKHYLNQDGSLHCIDQSNGSFFMVRARDFDAVGGWCPFGNGKPAGYDNEFYQRLDKLGLKRVVLQTPFKHFWHPDTGSCRVNNEYAFQVISKNCVFKNGKWEEKMKEITLTELEERCLRERGDFYTKEKYDMVPGNQVDHKVGQLRWKDHIPAMAYALGIFPWDKIVSTFQCNDKGGGLTPQIGWRKQVETLKSMATRMPQGVLEVGCGKGELSMAFLALGVPTIAVEPARGIADLFKETIQNFGFEKSPFVYNEFLITCYDKINYDHIDTIIMVDSLEHMPKKEAFTFFNFLKNLGGNRRLIICHPLTFWPIAPGSSGLSPMEHPTRVDDGYYDDLCVLAKRLIYRNGPQLVVEF